MKWLENILEWLTRPRVSVSEQEATILMLLATKGEMYGLDMVHAAPDILGEDSIYVVLTRMMGRRLITARYETHAEQKYRGPLRRLYKITDEGRRKRREVPQSIRGTIRGVGQATA